MNDIDLSGVNWTIIGGSSDNPFAGILDGNGYEIKNLTINDTTSEFVGFIGLSTGTLNNVVLTDVNITAGENAVYVGALAGGAMSYHTGVVDNCHVSGSVVVNALGSSYTSAGGLVGYFAGIILNSSSSVDVTAHGVDAPIYTGGLIGTGMYFSANNCFSYGNVDTHNRCIGS